MNWVLLGKKCYVVDAEQRSHTGTVRTRTFEGSIHDPQNPVRSSLAQDHTRQTWTQSEFEGPCCLVGEIAKAAV